MNLFRKRRLELIGVIAALVALALPWQSNQIGLRQVTPHVIVLNVITEVGEMAIGVSAGRAACFHAIRLQNLGGAATAMIGYGVDIWFAGQEVRAEGRGGEIGIIIQHLHCITTLAGAYIASVLFKQ